MEPDIVAASEDVLNVAEQSQDPNSNGETKGNREKRPRNEKRSEYEYNADIINENTIIPPLPKKSDIIPKPDMKEIKEKESRNRERIDKLIEKKKQIRAERFRHERKNVVKGEESKHSTFQQSVAEAKQLRERFLQVKAQRNSLKDQLAKLFEETKANNKSIKEYGGSWNGSRENCFDRLQLLEKRLLSEELTKEAEKQLNNEITLVKRKIREAESSGNIEIKLARCEELQDQLEDKIEKLKKDKQPIEAEYNRLKTQLDQRNQYIDGLKKELNEESQGRTEEKLKNDQEYEKWKEGKAKKLDKLEDEVKKISAENNKLWDEYNASKDAYWKQKQYIDFIEWQTKVKNHKIYQKEREKRRAEAEERDKLKEKEEKLQKYIREIETCNFLVNYCNGLKQGKKQEEKVQVKAVDVSSALAEDTQWKKEKGLVVLQPKKKKEEEESEKKQKKQRKPKEEVFSIPFNIQALFQGLKILAPASVLELDAKIAELRQREELFERACKEDVSETDNKLITEIKGQVAKPVSEIKKPQLTEEDFPAI